MSIELRMLGWSVLLGLVYVLASGIATTAQRGLRYGAGARDDEHPLTGMAGRTHRALRNFLETYPLFVAAVLVARISGRVGETTAVGAQLYVWARLVYLPLYVLGVPFIRSLAWLAAVAGLVLVLVGLV